MTIFLAFLERFWKPLAVACVILATLTYATVIKHDRDAIRAEYAVFVATVKVQGEAAKKSAQIQEAADKKRKDTADAENVRLRTANAALARSLRESRSSAGYLPKPAPGSASPDRITFDREALESAIRRLDDGLSAIAESGDQAITDLDTAKRWAQ
jgi:hypothetical protein